MFLTLSLFVLVILFAILGSTVWGKKTLPTGCFGTDVKVAYPSAGPPLTNYYFGNRVSISGDTLVVGAPGSPQDGIGDANFSGCVYVYTDGNYGSTPIKAATPPAGAPSSFYQFGHSISISGNTLAVGAVGSTQAGTGTRDFSGCVYVYTDGNYDSTPIKAGNPSTGAPLENYQFGYSVSISGDTLAVGAVGSPQDGIGGANNSGCVYVYKDGNYDSTPIKAGNPSTGTPLANYYFGYSISISGDTLAVGAFGSPQDGTGDANDSGCVYVYKDGNYDSTPIKAGNPSTGTPLANYRFGWSVSISGDTLAVGAYGSPQDGTGVADLSGCVYVYTNGNYGSTPIKAGNPSTGAPLAFYQFGRSVAISGDTLVVGAYGSPQSGIGGEDYSGCVYVYTNGNYHLTPIKVSNVGDFIPLDDYYFGQTVAVDGNAVVVGAHGQTATGTGTANNAGGAYVYPCIGY